MLRQIGIQVRPNINVQWGLASSLGIPLLDFKTKYPEYYVQEPIVEISEDGLTRTQTFVFKDGFIWQFTDEEKANYDKISKYCEDNGIIVSHTTDDF